MAIKSIEDEKLIELIVSAIEDKKGLDIKVLELKKSIADFMVICSAESEPQIRAISDLIEEKVKKIGVKGFKWQGVIGSGWRVLDLGNIIVHIMGVKERHYYKLEELWEKRAIIYHY